MLDEDSPRYQRKANALARSWVRIKQCKKCGDPTVDGYCCPSCGDANPDMTREQETARDEKYAAKRAGSR